MPEYDLVILGSGPGGYVAAIRAAQLGIKTAIVERADVGGVCLNWGCIPSKALIRNAEVLRLCQNARDYGISFDNLSHDFGAAIDRSRKVVKRLTQGISFLLKKNNVEYVNGTGVLLDCNTIQVEDGGQKLTTAHVIIATGAQFRELPALPIDGNIVITSREALALRNVPPRIVIVGGGATGAEFAYIYAAYGAEVTVVELLPRLVPQEDEEISEHLERSFAKQNINVLTGHRVEGVEIDGDSAKLTVSNGASSSVISSDKVLVAVGAQGNIASIGLERLGVATDQDFIAIDERMSTNVPNIYAIGDVTGKMLLAHVASAQGVAAVENIAGLDSPKLEYELMPRATYCNPQVASFGITETQANERGLSVKIGKFPFSASGKAQAMGKTEGIVKVIIDADIGDVLGAHMIGHEATELLGELSIARLLEGTSSEIGWLAHPHPTISETVKEATLAAENQAVHV